MDLKKETILDEQLQEIEIFDKPGLFSNSRLRDEDVPEGCTAMTCVGRTMIRDSRFWWRKR